MLDYYCLSPRIIPRYSVERFHGTLPPEEFMFEFGTELAKMYQANPKKYEEKYYDLFHEFRNVERALQELMEKIKELRKEWSVTE